MIGQIFFYVMAALAIFGAIATVVARNPIRGAMGLLVMILSVAGFFLALHAEFLAAIQLIVYAGAIVILFMFVLMLLGPSAVPAHDQRGQIWRTVAGAIFGLLGAGAIWFAYKGFTVDVPAKGEVDAHTVNLARSPALGLAPAGYGGIDEIGHALFTTHLVPFEISSALLMVAVIGAVAVAKGKKGSKDLIIYKELDTPEIDAPGTATAVIAEVSP